MILGLAGLSAINHAAPQSALLFLPPLLAYLWVAYRALTSLQPVKVKSSRYGDTLWPDFWDSTPELIRWGIVRAITDDYTWNGRHLTDKATALRAVLFTVGIETAGLAVLLAFTRLTS